MEKELGMGLSGMAAGSKAANTASYVLIGRILTFVMTDIALVIVARLLGPSQYWLINDG